MADIKYILAGTGALALLAGLESCANKNGWLERSLRMWDIDENTANKAGTYKITNGEGELTIELGNVENARALIFEDQFIAGDGKLEHQHDETQLFELLKGADETDGEAGAITAQQITGARQELSGITKKIIFEKRRKMLEGNEKRLNIDLDDNGCIGCVAPEYVLGTMGGSKVDPTQAPAYSCRKNHRVQHRGAGLY